MNSSSITPKAQYPSILGITTKAIIAAGLLAFIYTQLSTGQVMLLAMTVGLVLAFMNRIDNINATSNKHHKRAINSNSFDGGIYDRNQQVKMITNSSPAVNDGGSFERSSLKQKKAA